MKKILAGSLVLVSLTLVPFGLVSVGAENPLEGKIIALDAGHGDDGATGAVNQKYQIAEADVNWDVVQTLKVKLEVSGTYVVIADRLSTRRDRVNDALAKCAAVDINGDGVADNKKCDALVSVHHNGSSDPTHDGTLTIYTQKSDEPLAKALLNSLVPLTGKNEGMVKGGYGMTVYKNLVSAITEAYYITNDCEAELYLYSKGQLADISQECEESGYSLENRLDHEAQLQLEGLFNYFNALPTKPPRK
jgi:N-acetylmuramoyl-L-alanine amidase